MPNVADDADAAGTALDMSNACTGGPKMDSRSDFLEEAAIMKEMKHPNLVQLLGELIGPISIYKLKFVQI